MENRQTQQRTQNNQHNTYIVTKVNEQLETKDDTVWSDSKLTFPNNQIC